MITITPHPDDPRAFRLVTELRLPRPAAEIFAYFADAYNLEQITPPWLRFQVETPRPIEMRAGAEIDYRLKLRGIPLHWRTEIQTWQPPLKFIDRQLRGPYRYWVHEHTFIDEGDTTRMRDQVDYAVPGGPLIHALFVRQEVRRIFLFRRQRMEQHFLPTARD